MIESLKKMNPLMNRSKSERKLKKNEETSPSTRVPSCSKMESNKDGNELNSGELRLMEKISGQNSKMRRKLQYSETMRERPTKSSSLRSRNGHVKNVVITQTESQQPKEIVDVDDMKKQIQELEKKQDMYRNRIMELEQQVSTFSVFHMTNNPNLHLGPSKLQFAAPAAATQPRENNSYIYGKELPVPPVQQNSLVRKISSLNSKNDSFIPVADSSVHSEWIEQASKLPSIPVPNAAQPTNLLALYEYNAPSNSPNKLSFKEGDVLHLIRKSSRSDWWVAELNGKVGRIPSNYVEQLDHSWTFKARVTKNYDPLQPGDLSIQRGELITILKTQENGWYLGEKGGKTGFFPSEAIERIPPTP